MRNQGKWNWTALSVLTEHLNFKYREDDLCLTARLQRMEAIKFYGPFAAVIFRAFWLKVKFCMDLFYLNWFLLLSCLNWLQLKLFLCYLLILALECTVYVLALYRSLVALYKGLQMDILSKTGHVMPFSNLHFKPICLK